MWNIVNMFGLWAGAPKCYLDMLDKKPGNVGLLVLPWLLLLNP